MPRLKHVKSEYEQKVEQELFLTGMKKGERVFSVTLVKLKSGKYSVPNGSIGFLRELVAEGEGVSSFLVSWAQDPGPAGSSVPVLDIDLENLGTIWVPMPDAGKLRAALERIRDRYWVEHALDPQWAAGVAREALDA